MQNIIGCLFSGQPLPGISIMGLDGAGKSTLLNKLASSSVVTAIPTVGFNIETARICVPASNAKAKKLNFTARSTDVGGCSNLQPFVIQFMIDNDVSALIWVVDTSDTDRYAESVEELDRLVHGVRTQKDMLPSSMPILILANKIDVPNKHSIDVLRPQIEALMHDRPFMYTNTCCTAPVASSGLPEAFAWLAEVIATSRAMSSGEAQSRGSEKCVETMLSDLRAPATLAAKLEEWVARAESDDTAEELLRRFYALDLPQWDHYIHLRLAYILLLKHGRREGKDKIFEGFKDYIDNSGKDSGKSFHTTMTYFWVQMVHLGIASQFGDLESHTLKNNNEEKATRLDSFAKFLLVNQYLADAQLWADYYSKEVLMSKEAREGVRLPDIMSLPTVLSKTRRV